MAWLVLGRPRRYLAVLALAATCLVSAVTTSLGQVLPQEKDNEESEVTTLKGPAADLVRKWWKEKTAAGNKGDQYENRDEGHSPLDLKPFPQLKPYEFTEQEKKSRANWAGARIVRPQVTIGNSSTSAPPALGGSNPRQFYSSPKGLPLLYEQYVGNNLYVYPEHLDHDPGRGSVQGPIGGEGFAGFGDLFPTNSPYLIISQGSSYSDQPFLKALTLVLAAFRPETKKKLIETGLLMPTIQRILRTTGKQIRSPDDYLTALAHPTAFDGSQLDEVAMVQAAHELKEDEIPPLVKLEVVKEPSFQSGTDYFDVAPSEVLATTPCVIARVFRAAERSRKFTISAAKTKDANGRALQFHWVVLRGDPERVKLHALDGKQTDYEIEVRWQPRRLVHPSLTIESNRVDIAVVAHNGSHYTAPSFVTFFFLDNEDRVYDDRDRILEWAHPLGGIHFDIQDWGRMIDYALTPTGAQMLELSGEELARIRVLAERFRDRDEACNVAKRSLAQASDLVKKMKADKAIRNDPSVKVMEASVLKAQKTFQEAEAARSRLLDGNENSFPFRSVVLERLPKTIERGSLLSEVRRSESFRKASPSLRASLDKRMEEYKAWGLRDPSEELPRSAFARSRRAFMHAEVINDLVFAGILKPSYRIHFVDQKITAPQGWRDVYHWDDKLGMLGWTRYDGKTKNEKKEFSRHGYLVLEKDDRGRCVLGRVVRYTQAAVSGAVPNNNPLFAVATDEVIKLRYGRGDPPEGKIVERLKRPTDDSDRPSSETKPSVD